MAKSHKSKSVKAKNRKLKVVPPEQIHTLDDSEPVETVVKLPDDGEIVARAKPSTIRRILDFIGGY
jgi:hypothetical protein